MTTIQNIDFSNTKGQLTPRSEVGSGQNSNSSEMSRMSLLLPRMKKIRSKLKALEWPKYKILIFQTLKGSLLRSQRSELAEIRTHPRCHECPCYFKNEEDEDPLKKTEGARVAKIQNIDFSNTKGQLTPQSEVGTGRNSNSS